jgi:hypothetical protein
MFLEPIYIVKKIIYKNVTKLNQTPNVVKSFPMKISKFGEFFQGKKRLKNTTELKSESKCGEKFSNLFLKTWPFFFPENKQLYQQNTPLLILFFHTQRKKKKFKWCSICLQKPSRYLFIHSPGADNIYGRCKSWSLSASHVQE